MKKISTLFRKDPNDLSKVIDEVDPDNEWALTEGVATRKFDGSACAVIDGQFYKRYDAKKGRAAPANGIPCQDPDPISGHYPFWVPVDINKSEDKYFIQGLKESIYRFGTISNGTYELIGEKIQANPEKIEGHILVKHGADVISLYDRSFEGIKAFLSDQDIEGIVFHHPDGRMCKIRKSDFGLKREIDRRISLIVKTVGPSRQM